MNHDPLQFVKGLAWVIGSLLAMWALFMIGIGGRKK